MRAAFLGFLLLLSVGDARTLWAGQSPEVADFSELESDWAERARDFDGEWVGAEPIAAVVARLEEFVSDNPRDLKSINFLLQALQFQGQYSERDEEVRKAIYERGVEVASAILIEIHGSADLGKEDPEELANQAAEWEGAGELHFWSAVHWGLFGETQGSMKALRRGVAKKIRTHAQTAILLAPEVHAGGPYRVLGRMHAVAPKVVMVTGWISREEAVVLLEKAFEIAPEEPQNRQFLYEIWYEEVPEKEDEALEGLTELAGSFPRPDFVAEDTRLIRLVSTELQDR